jgi:hypothetical protein
MIDPCPRCNKDRALVGFEHRCVPLVTPVSVTGSVTETKEERTRRLTRERVAKLRAKKKPQAANLGP